MPDPSPSSSPLFPLASVNPTEGPLCPRTRLPLPSPRRRSNPRVRLPIGQPSDSFSIPYSSLGHFPRSPRDLRRKRPLRYFQPKAGSPFMKELHPHFPGGWHFRKLNPTCLLAHTSPHPLPSLLMSRKCPRVPNRVSPRPAPPLSPNPTIPRIYLSMSMFPIGFSVFLLKDFLHSY